MSPFDKDAVTRAIQSAFDGMKAQGPKGLLSRVNFELEDGGAGFDVEESELIAAITTADPNAAARKSAHMAISRWDAQDDPPWAPATSVGSEERREKIYDLLRIGEDGRADLDTCFPNVAQKDIVIAQEGPWDPWYTDARAAAHDFYWQAYAGVLERKGWPAPTIASLDESTANIVGRLADPTSDSSYQTKGLVVGYVQSGKTANFTGITAKAIDAGYRLIIVLTGTIELLRGQTQRRLDMELIGEENIVGGRDRNDPHAIRDVDYIGVDHDEDWYAGKFLRHNIDIKNTPGIPSIIRLTSAHSDFKQLKLGLDALDFRRTGELKNPLKPVYDPENIFDTDVRIAVIKKNTSALKNLLKDLGSVHADMKEMPVLIIDDEADQASINTTNPKRGLTAEDAKKRTAINGLISQLLTKLPRAQYLGYTATPFANVFVSPDDAGDIFPKDFIISLEPSPEYFGGKKFHDLAPLTPEDRVPATSNEAAFVRDLKAYDEAGERAELLRALDAFVLTGALKLWRSAQDPTYYFHHHTMLVHQSVRQEEHTALADLIRDTWNTGGYTTAEGAARLSALLEGDFRSVHDSRDSWTRLPFPPSFFHLRKYVGEALGLILASGDPVVIVNGAKDSDYDAMDFQKQRYWRVMVGGAKLSRGFTVEGLTISYYRRRASAADTLMQMGRWFGYRPGYEDLVRLHIARDVVDGKGKSYDLYDMFTSILEDEEEFREQLRAFAELDEDGRPLVLPKNVPPMVFAQLPWLKPTGTNRMYNAVLKEMARGGKLVDRFKAPIRSRGQHAHNFELLAGLLHGANTVSLEQGGGGHFPALVVTRSAAEVSAVLRQLRWEIDGFFEPDLQFIINAEKKETLKSWKIVVPVLASSTRRTIQGSDIPLIRRARRPGRNDFSGSDPKHRAIIEYLAGSNEYVGIIDRGELRGDGVTQAAMLLNFAYEPADGKPIDPLVSPDELSSDDVVSLVSLAFPLQSAPRGRIAFGVRQEANKDEAIVDIS